MTTFLAERVFGGRCATVPPRQSGARWRPRIPVAAIATVAVLLLAARGAYGATKSSTTTLSSSVTPTISLTSSITATASSSVSMSATGTTSGTITSTVTNTGTTSGTRTGTKTGSGSLTSSATYTPSSSTTGTSTPSNTASITSTSSSSQTPTPSISPSSTYTPSQTPTLSESLSNTASITASTTSTKTLTGTRTASKFFTVTPTASITPSISYSTSGTLSISVSGSLSPSYSSSLTPTPSLTASNTVTPTASASLALRQAYLNTPTSGTSLILHEDGAAITYGLSLDAYTVGQHAAEVSVIINATGTFAGVLAVSPSVLRWTASTPWSATQYVTVSLGRDWIALSRSEDIFTGVLTHTTWYESVFVGAASTLNITVSSVDADMPGVLLSRQDLYVAEGGAINDTYGIQLRSRPVAPVVIGLTVAGIAAGALVRPTVAESTLTFSPTTWNVTQNVSVVAERDTAFPTRTASGLNFSISHAVASSDPIYASLPSTYFRNSDVLAGVAANADDNCGAIEPASAFAMRRGQTISYTVRLCSAPLSATTLIWNTTGDREWLTSGTRGGTYSWPASATALAVAVIVNMTAMPDLPAFTRRTVVVHHYLATDANEAVALTPNRDVVLTLYDPQLPYLAVQAPSRVSIGAGQLWNLYNLTVRPATKPAATVNITTRQEGPANPDSTPVLSGPLVTWGSNGFDNVTWGEARWMTIGSMPSTLAFDTPQVFNLTLGAASAGDPAYNGSSAVFSPRGSTVVTVLSARVPAIRISRVTLFSQEVGGADNERYTIELTSRPRANVTVSMVYSLEAGIQLQEPAARNVTFTSSNWDLPQTVTVAFASVPTYNNRPKYNITHIARSSDAAYNDTRVDEVLAATLTGASDGGGGNGSALFLPRRVVRGDVYDKLVPVVLLRGTGVTVMEGGWVSVALTIATKPSASVTISLQSLVQDVGYPLNPAIISPLYAKLVPSDWTDTNNVITFNISCPTDVYSQGDAVFTATWNVTSADTDYGAMPTRILPQNRLSITRLDANYGTIALSTTALYITALGVANYTVVLTAAPPVAVTVSIAFNATLVTVNPVVVTFTAANYSLPVLVSVAPAQYALENRANLVATLNHTWTTADAKWAATIITPKPTVTVSITNIARPAIIISRPQLAAAKGAAITYTLTLESRPAANVTLTVNVTLPSPAPRVTVNGSALPATFTLTPASLFQPFPLQLAVLDDLTDYGLTALQGSVTHTIASNDGDYNGSIGAAAFLPSNTLPLTILDNTVACRRNCVSGTYQLFNGTATECAPCPVGWRCAGGCLPPVICAAGESSPPGNDTCFACSAGRFESGRRCYDCQPGNSTGTAGSTFCSVCPRGTTALHTAATVCTACQPGLYSNETTVACAVCPPRYIAASAGATNCSYVGDGYADDHNRTAAKPCREGEFANVSTTTCVQCPAGRFASTPAASTCVVCPPGYWSSGADQPCQRCDPGFESNSTDGYGAGGCRSCKATYGDRWANASAGVVTCQTCTPGKVPGEANAFCVDCPAGYYDLLNGTSRASCVACPNGTYQNDTGAYGVVAISTVPGVFGGCRLCPKGYATASLAATFCSPCPNGTVSELDGQALCADCPTAVTAAGTCLSCDDKPGHIAVISGNDAVCEACAAGSYKVGGVNRCDKCPAGSISASTNATICSNCTAGFFSANSGSTTCTPCPAGSFAANDVATLCLPCSAGSETNGSTSARTCSLCSVGRFSNTAGTPTCSLCEVGSVAAGNGSTACTPCTGNTVAESRGLSVCTACAPGRSRRSDFGSCDECSIGRYNSGSFTSCQVCPVGRIAPTVAVAECTNCSIGFFVASTGAGSCRPCAPGSYGNVTGATVCPLCGPGFYSGDRNSTNCTACSGNLIASASGLTSCTVCEPGRVRNSNYTQCIACAPGFVHLGEVCVQCAAGFFAGVGQPSPCSPCSAGSYQNNTAASSCILCGNGTFALKSNSSVCTDCAPRFRRFNTENTTATQAAQCERCPDGTISDAARVACLVCAPGQRQVNNTCELCPPGFATNGLERQTSCRSCARGTYAPLNGTAVCIGCTNNTYSNDTASVCLTCPLGSIHQGHSTCLNCSAGRSHYGNETCMQCPPGRFSLPGQAGACPLCPPGSFQPLAESSTCTICGNGTNVTLPGATACELCPSRTIRNNPPSDVDLTDFAPAATCASCPAGYISNPTRTQCLLCPGGRYQQGDTCVPCTGNLYAPPSGGATACQLCTQGFIVATDRSSCTPCQLGTYHLAQTNTTCTLAPRGTFVSVVNATTPSPCPAGTQGVVQGASVCETCGTGTYQNSTGQTSCIACPAGSARIHPDGGAATLALACTACAPGSVTINPVVGARECTLCPAGTYQQGNTCPSCTNNTYSAAGATVCTPCDFGTITSSSFRACVACPTGRYHAHVSNVTCTDASRGYYVPSEAATSQHPCPMGSYNDDVRQASCLLCKSGEYQPATGQRSCLTCLPNTFRINVDGDTWDSDPPVAAACSICPAGRISNAPDDVCAACSAGRFANATDNTCRDCTGNTFANSPNGEDVCRPCAQGTIHRAHLACEACRAGTFHAHSSNETCTSCPPGRFSANANQTVCDPCPAGSYSDDSGASRCVLCPAGTYADMLGLSACTACPPRAFRSNPDNTDVSNATLATACQSCPPGSAVNTQRTSCTPCGTGRYQVNDSCFDCDVTANRVQKQPNRTLCDVCEPGFIALTTTLCQPCDPGFYHEAPNSRNCLQCVPGFAAGSPNTTACQSCELGRFAEAVRATSCSDCISPRYANATNMTGCLTCPARHIGIPRVRSDRCIPCWPGERQLGGECRVCEAGFFQDGNVTTGAAADTCVRCPGNTYSAANATVCIDCPPGRVTGDGITCGDCPAGSRPVVTGCELCPRGFWSPVASPSCLLVPIGFFSPVDGTQLPQSCAPGTFANVSGLTACYECGAGFAAAAEAANCTLCPTGRFATARAPLCRPCATGTYNNGTGASTCLPCASGSFAISEGQPLCQECPLGRATPSQQTTECQTCELGRFANVTGLLTCRACEPGTVAEARELPICRACTVRDVAVGTGNAACVTCANGNIAVDNNSRCQRCTAGFAQLNRSVNVCTACGPGFAQGSDGTESCPICPIGRFAPGADNSVCTDCAAGFFAPLAGTPSCLPCMPGTFSAAGAGICSPCARGTASPINSTRDRCPLCEPGFVANSTGMALCDPCGPGTAATGPGLFVCTDCRPGYYSGAANNSQCTAARPGEMVALSRQSAPILCDPGWVSRAFASVTCVQCPHSVYSPRGSGECLPCRNGTYVPKGQAAECIMCPINAVAPERSDRCTQCGPDWKGAIAAYGNSTCIPCPPGTRREGLSCVQCPGGFYSSQSVTQVAGVSRIEGAEVCSICSAGRFSTGGNGSCTMCNIARNEYAPLAGATSCLIAPLGSRLSSDATGAQLCPPGTLVNTANQSFPCISCANGFYSPNSTAAYLHNSNACWACERGRYQSPGLTGMSTCQLCDEGQLKETEGQGLCLSCPDGSISRADRTGCIRCDTTRFDCSNRRASVRTSGFWFSGNISNAEDLVVVTQVSGNTVGTSNALHECLNVDACQRRQVFLFNVNGTSSLVPPVGACSNLTITIDTNSTTVDALCPNASYTALLISRCATGYAGVLCANCETGYALDWDDSTCVACGAGEASPGRTIVAAFAVLIAAIIFIRQSPSTDGYAVPAFRIAVVYVQLLLLIGSFVRKQWSPLRDFSWIIRYLGEPLWRLYAPLQCNYDVRFRETFYLTLLFPIFLAFFCFAINAGFYLVRKVAPRFSRMARDRIMHVKPALIADPRYTDDLLDLLEAYTDYCHDPALPRPVLTPAGVAPITVRSGRSRSRKHGGGAVGSNGLLTPSPHRTWQQWVRWCFRCAIYRRHALAGVHTARAAETISATDIDALRARRAVEAELHLLPESIIVDYVDRRELSDKTVLSLVTLMHIVFFSIITTVFKAFVFYKEPVIGRYYLKADFRVTYDSSEYAAMYYTGLIAVAFYFVYVPGLLLLLTWRSQTRLVTTPTSLSFMWPRLRYLYDGTLYVNSPNYVLRQHRDEVASQTSNSATRAREALAAGEASTLAPGEAAAAKAADAEAVRAEDAAEDAVDGIAAPRSRAERIADNLARLREKSATVAPRPIWQALLECRVGEARRSFLYHVLGREEASESRVLLGTWWFEWFVTMRRISVAAICLLFSFEFEVQMFALLFLLVPLLAINLWMDPFDTHRVSQLETLTLIGLLFTALMSVLANKPSYIGRRDSVLTGTVGLNAAIFVLCCLFIIRPFLMLWAQLMRAMCLSGDRETARKLWSSLTVDDEYVDLTRKSVTEALSGADSSSVRFGVLHVHEVGVSGQDLADMVAANHLNRMPTRVGGSRQAPKAAVASSPAEASPDGAAGDDDDSDDGPETGTPGEHGNLWDGTATPTTAQAQQVDHRLVLITFAGMLKRLLDIHTPLSSTATTPATSGRATPRAALPPPVAAVASTSTPLAAASAPLAMSRRGELAAIADSGAGTGLHLTLPAAAAPQPAPAVSPPAGAAATSPSSQVEAAAAAADAADVILHVPELGQSEALLESAASPAPSEGLHSDALSPGSGSAGMPHSLPDGEDGAGYLEEGDAGVDYGDAYSPEGDAVDMMAPVAVPVAAPPRRHAGVPLASFPEGSREASSDDSDEEAVVVWHAHRADAPGGGAAAARTLSPASEASLGSAALGDGGGGGGGDAAVAYAAGSPSSGHYEGDATEL